MASYSALFTIALVGGLLALALRAGGYGLVGQHHRDLFPQLPGYSRYHRIVRNAEPLWAGLAQPPGRRIRGPEVINARPLPIARGQRWEGARRPEAHKGFSTMGMVWGFKLHAVVSLGGLCKRWMLVLVHVEDRIHGNTLGDKAYVGTSCSTANPAISQAKSISKTNLPEH